METYTKTTETKLYEARKHVKRIKGFYIHLLVYVLVNFVIIVSDVHDNPSEIYNFETYATAFFWGIGLVAHAASVFGSKIFFGNDWEQRKIREYMNK